MTERSRRRRWLRHGQSVKARRFRVGRSYQSGCRPKLAGRQLTNRRTYSILSVKTFKASPMSDRNNVEACSADPAQLEEAPPFLGRRFSDSELVIGLVGAVGTDLQQVVAILKERLKAFKYDVEELLASRDITPPLLPAPQSSTSENP